MQAEAQTIPTDPIAAMADLWQENYAAMRNYVAKRTNLGHLAEEITDQVFMRALEAWVGGKGPTEHVKGWLFRIAHNLIIDRYREITKRGHPVEIDALENFLFVDDTDDVFFRNYRSEVLRHAISRLTARQAQVITMRLDGYSFDEIGAAMDTNEGAVKALLHRGTETLRVLLAGQRDLLLGTH